MIFGDFWCSYFDVHQRHRVLISHLIAKHLVNLVISSLVGSGDECFPSPPGQRQRDNGVLAVMCTIHVVVHDVLCQT